MWSCSRLGCADLCKVTLLCLWILCSILSVPQVKICGSLVSSKSLPLFVLLIFSLSSVGKLRVCNCLKRYLRLGLLGSMWFFLYSSIRVLVFLVGICPFLKLVCRKWRWISWTRNPVFHHGRAFSSLIFLGIVLSKSMCIPPFGSSLSPYSFLVILFIHSAFSLCFGCFILVKNRSVSFASGCWYVFVSSPPSCW